MNKAQADTDTLHFTILGCASSGGVPRIGNDWGACDPNEPKNRRRRCSLLVRRRNANGETRVLIDTSPDLREQLLSAHVGALDGVLFTHEHADHIHGIDDLRAVYFNMGRKRVPVYANARTAEMLQSRFGYCFATPANSPYPPILELNLLLAGRAVAISGAGGPVVATPMELEHGIIRSYGFRIGNLAYTPDLNGIPEESLPLLENLDVWIVDALRPGPKPHPTHFVLEEALKWIERLRPRRAILTNLHVLMDYATLKSQLPAHIEPAHDGLEITLSAEGMDAEVTATPASGEVSE